MSKRILISAMEKEGSLDQPMDPRFGRAHCFLIVEGDTLTWLDNNARSASHGAGVEAVSTVGKNKIDAVISGEFGPKAHGGLKGISVAHYVAPEGITVREALDSLERGDLKAME